MNKVWYISDTHFSHHNIIKYCNRPFSNSLEMDAILIKNINDHVSHEDTLYHLGDFCMGYAKNIIGRIVCPNIIFLRGNHDKWLHHSTPSHREIRIDGQDITLCHYPMYSWNKSHHGAWNLYGHVHGKEMIGLKGFKSLDVGVDATAKRLGGGKESYRPVSHDEVKSILDNIPLYHTVSSRGDNESL